MTANTGLGVPDGEVQYEGNIALALVALVFMVGVVIDADNRDPS